MLSNQQNQVQNQTISIEKKQSNQRFSITSEMDKTPGFPEDDQDNELESCLYGISDLIIFNNIIQQNESCQLISICSMTLQENSFEYQIKYQNQLLEFDFSQLKKQQNQLAFISQQLNDTKIKEVEVVETNMQEQDGSMLLQSIQRNQNTVYTWKTKLNDKEVESKIIVLSVDGRNPQRLSNQKYNNVESHYSPKNLQKYLNKQHVQHPVNQKWVNYGKLKRSYRSQSNDNSYISQTNLTTSMISLKPKIQQTQAMKSLNQNRFCLISKKHKQLANSKQITQQNSFEISKVSQSLNYSSRYATFKKE